ncbi:GNAT superfamily N-acetyltransferase [Bradyrhizobium sp. USDA 4449]
MTEPHWRHARAGDLLAISAIAARIHPELPERPEVLSEKMRLCPDGCRVLAAGDEIAGYGLAHPWMQRHVPPLDGFLIRLPEAADCLYLHDIAVLPGFRGGVARAYVAEIEGVARASEITTIALVSVYGTRGMWQRFGFRPAAADAALRDKLSSYGAGATYMLRAIPPRGRR